MAYDESETKQSKVVVETPNARREVTETQHQYTPERGGTSTATIAVVVILAVGVVVLLSLLIMNRQTNDSLAAQQQAQQPAPQQPVIVQQPAQQQQPPIIVQQPAAPASQPPVIINQPAPAGGSVPTVPDDGSIQAEIDKGLQKDSTLSTLDVTATVANGTVMLVGSVKSDQLKSQVEKLVRAVNGVKRVDNKIIVVSA